MNKKLFTLLLIFVLGAFVLTGCDMLPPANGDGDGDGDGVTPVTEVSIVIEGAYEKGGVAYVQAEKAYEVIATFPKPEFNVHFETKEGWYFAIPNSDKTVWTAEVEFDFCSNGCTYDSIWVEWGLCEDCYYGIPIRIDSEDPYACIDVALVDCTCEGCQLTFKSTSQSKPCADPDECCGDDCSGLAGWSIELYDREPFDECCANPCWKPVFTCSGTDCPIDCVTDCFYENGEYKFWAVVTLEDNVGNTARYYATITFTISEGVCGNLAVTEYYADRNDCECTTWLSPIEDTGCDIGACEPWYNCGAQNKKHSMRK